MLNDPDLPSFLLGLGAGVVVMLVLAVILAAISGGGDEEEFDPYGPEPAPRPRSADSSQDP